MVARPLRTAMADGGEDDEDEWRYSLADLETADDEDDAGSNVAGSFMPDEKLEPGHVDLENAFFVLLGVVTAGLVVIAFVLALT